MRRVILLYLILPFFCVSCDTADQQRIFNDEALEEPAGYTFTDEGGRIPLNDKGEYISFDPDDWRTGPAFSGSISFEPAYPNPTEGDLVIIPIVIKDFDGFPGGLQLRAFGNFEPQSLYLIDDLFEASAGSHAFRFDPSELSAAGDLTSIKGLHRLFIFSANGDLVSYGDLLID